MAITSLPDVPACSQLFLELRNSRYPNSMPYTWAPQDTIAPGTLSACRHWSATWRQRGCRVQKERRWPKYGCLYPPKNYFPGANLSSVPDLSDDWLSTPKLVDVIPRLHLESTTYHFSLEEAIGINEYLLQRIFDSEIVVRKRDICTRNRI